MDLSLLKLGRLGAIGRRRVGVVADESGAAAVEFALLLPVLCLLLFGIIKLGIVLNNYVQLTNATAAAARQLAISRGAATPYTDTTSAIAAAAPNLTSTSITKTFTVTQANGTLVSCSSSASCPASAWGDGTASPPLQATATLAYPCNLTIFTIVAASCSLSSTSSGAVQ